MHELTLTGRTVTPTYLAGADDQPPELRAPSLKGLIRFWYRAFNLEFQQREPIIFGGAGKEHGQSAFLLHSQADSFRPWSWNRSLIDRFTEGQGRFARNGIAYLANMAVPKRLAIPAGVPFKVRLAFPYREPDRKVRREVAGSLWLLFHLGGAGSRSRRGFGSFSLEDWIPQPANAWPELEELPLLAKCRDGNDGLRALKTGLNYLRNGSTPAGKNQSLNLTIHGDEFRFLVDPRGVSDSKPDAWASALNEAGRALQDFRSRHQPDYDDVRGYLAERSRLEHAPERATFGLPITFRFSTARGSAQFQAFRGTPGGGEDSDRHASPLFIRLLRIGKSLHPAYFRLAGPVPAMGGNSTYAIVKNSRRPLEPPAVSALDQFMTELQGRWKGGATR